VPVNSDEHRKDDMAASQRYSWPGNIRELRNVVERAMIMVTGRRLTFLMPAASTASAGPGAKLEDVEREHICTCSRARAGASGEWNGAAGRLGLKPTTLESRLARLVLRRPESARAIAC
jgi:formate hydrogenlyase transcriptional activator